MHCICSLGTQNKSNGSRVAPTDKDHLIIEDMYHHYIIIMIILLLLHYKYYQHLQLVNYMWSSSFSILIPYKHSTHTHTMYISILGTIDIHIPVLEQVQRHKAL